MKEKRIIVITGNMGSGKTTFGRSLAAELSCEFFEEPVFENPLLGKFFANPVKYCFDLQEFFIHKRIEALKEVVNVTRSCVLDRSILDSRNAYIPVHKKLGHINDEQYATLVQMIDELRKNLPKPDLMVFLNPGFDKTLEQVKARDRDFERGLDIVYFKNLQEEYEKFFNSHSEGPKLLLSDYYDVTLHLDEIRRLCK